VKVDAHSAPSLNLHRPTSLSPLFPHTATILLIITCQVLGPLAKICLDAERPISAPPKCTEISLFISPISSLLLRHAEDPAVGHRWAFACARQLEDNGLRLDWSSHSSEIEDGWTESFSLPSAGRFGVGAETPPHHQEGLRRQPV
jgi:hypothetical protein